MLRRACSAPMQAYCESSGQQLCLSCRWLSTDCCLQILIVAAVVDFGIAVINGERGARY